MEPFECNTAGTVATGDGNPTNINVLFVISNEKQKHRWATNDHDRWINNVEENCNYIDPTTIKKWYGNKVAIYNVILILNSSRKLSILIFRNEYDYDKEIKVVNHF